MEARVVVEMVVEETGAEGTAAEDRVAAVMGREEGEELMVVAMEAEGMVAVGMAEAVMEAGMEVEVTGVRWGERGAQMAGVTGEEATEGAGKEGAAEVQVGLEVVEAAPHLEERGLEKAEVGMAVATVVETVEVCQAGANVEEPGAGAEGGSG